MKILIPKISYLELSKTDLRVFNTLSSKNYGKELAIKITEKLILKPESKDIYFSHRDYCGIGIFFDNDTFILSTVYDGYGIDSVIIEFDSKAEFMEWLANENDQSMALYGKKFNNQTITKLRLDWYLEKNYSPVWNDYCLYAREISK